MINCPLPVCLLCPWRSKRPMQCTQNNKINPPKITQFGRKTEKCWKKALPHSYKKENGRGKRGVLGIHQATGKIKTSICRKETAKAPHTHCKGIQVLESILLNKPGISLKTVVKNDGKGFDLGSVAVICNSSIWEAWGRKGSEFKASQLRQHRQILS